MGTDVAVVMAFRDMGCFHRRAAFGFVSAWYQQRGYAVVVEAGADDESFTRASAINAAVRNSDADVIVQSDPDSLVPEKQLREAITLARFHDGLVIPHTRYLYLSEGVTAAVLTDERLLPTLGPADCDDHGRMGSGNVVVFSRRTWEEAGGFDERFGLWGGDDGAFAVAAAAFCRPSRRRPGDMVHLWHPRLPQSVPGHPGYVEQFALVAQYRDAAALGPATVRDLLARRGSWAPAKPGDTPGQLLPQLSGPA
jgi:hypothetical protein